MKTPRRIDMLFELLENEPNDLFLNYAIGIEYVSLQNFEEAESQFKKVISFDENYIAAYYQLGKLFEAQSKNDVALPYFRNGLELARRKKDKSIHEFEEAIFLLED